MQRSLSEEILEAQACGSQVLVYPQKSRICLSFWILPQFSGQHLRKVIVLLDADV